jgi:hypothetical protein
MAISREIAREQFTSSIAAKLSHDPVKDLDQLLDEIDEEDAKQRRIKFTPNTVNSNSSGASGVQGAVGGSVITYPSGGSVGIGSPPYSAPTTIPPWSVQPPPHHPSIIPTVTQPLAPKPAPDVSEWVDEFTKAFEAKQVQQAASPDLTELKDLMRGMVARFAVMEKRINDLTDVIETISQTSEEVAIMVDSLINEMNEKSS